MLLLLSLNAFAQDYKPLENEFGIGLKAAGIWPLISQPIQAVIDTLQLRAMYTLNEKMTFRADFGFYGGNKKNQVETENSLVTLSEKQSGFIFAPGVEYHFAGTEMLDPFVGASLGLNFQGKKKTTSTSQFSSTTYEIYEEEPGNLKFDFLIISGFRFFVLERFSLGLEAGFGYQLSTKKGKEIYTVQNESEVSNITQTNGGFRTGGLAFHLSYFFGEMN